MSLAFSCIGKLLAFESINLNFDIKSALPGGNQCSILVIDAKNAKNQVLMLQNYSFSDNIK